MSINTMYLEMSINTLFNYLLIKLIKYFAVIETQECI